MWRLRYKSAMKRAERRVCLRQTKLIYYLGFFLVFQFFYYLGHLKLAQDHSDTPNAYLILDNFQMKKKSNPFHSSPIRQCMETQPARTNHTTDQFNRSLEILQAEPFLSQALVYIICVDDRSEEASIVTYALYDWAKTYVIHPTFWGDASFFLGILPQLLTKTNYTAGWIGSMPGNFRDDAILDADVIWMHRMLTDPLLIEQGFDLLLFSNSTHVASQSFDDTDEFTSLWKPIAQLIFEHIGDDPNGPSSVAKTRLYPMLRSLTFTARPELIQRFMDWLRKVILFMESDDRVLQILSSEQPCEVMKRSSWRFVNEYLIPYFFDKHAAKSISIGEYKQLQRCAGFLKIQQKANEVNDEVRFLVSSPTKNTSSTLFILCHSNKSCDYAGEQFIYYSWGHHIYFMPSTNLLETYFYTNILEHLMDMIGNTTAWVGSISWKAHQKTYVNIIDRMVSDERLVHDGVEVLAFWTPSNFDPRFCNSTMYINTKRVHSGLIEFIEYILRGIGENEEDIALLRQPYPKFKSFYGSYFVARPWLMRQYISWIKRVMVFLGKDPHARVYLWSDSTYKGDPSVPMKVYGVPFYPLHPFMGERLVQYFFNSRSSRIVLMMEYAKDHDDFDLEKYYSECIWWFDVNYNF